MMRYYKKEIAESSVDTSFQGEINITRDCISILTGAQASEKGLVKWNDNDVNTGLRRPEEKGGAPMWGGV